MGRYDEALDAYARIQREIKLVSAWTKMAHVEGSPPFRQHVFDASLYGYCGVSGHVDKRGNTAGYDMADAIGHTVLRGAT